MKLVTGQPRFKGAEEQTPSLSEGVAYVYKRETDGSYLWRQATTDGEAEKTTHRMKTQEPEEAQEEI